MSHESREKTARHDRSRSRSRSRSATRERNHQAATEIEGKFLSDSDAADSPSKIVQVVPEVKVKQDWADELLTKYPNCLIFDWGSKNNTKEDFARMHERKTPYASQPELSKTPRVQQTAGQFPQEQETKFTLDQRRMFRLLAEWVPAGCAEFDPTKVYGTTYENGPVKIEYERRETWCIDDYDTFGYYTIHLHGKLYVSISRE